MLFMKTGIQNGTFPPQMNVYFFLLALITQPFPNLSGNTVHPVKKNCEFNQKSCVKLQLILSETITFEINQCHGLTGKFCTLFITIV